jgi:hypothetical protein
MTEQRRDYCSACGRMMAKPGRGLSTIEFRRTVHKCADKDSLRKNLSKLIKIFRNATQDAELTVTFSQDFDAQLNDEWQEAGDIKLWLLEQINRLDSDAGEKAVYQLLFDLYAEEGIKESFAAFYDIYAERTHNPLSKNFVSRALRALGLKTRMVRMVVDGKEKSVISIQATATELQDIFRKNGRSLVNGISY